MSPQQNLAEWQNLWAKMAHFSTGRVWNAWRPEATRAGARSSSPPLACPEKTLRRLRSLVAINSQRSQRFNAFNAPRNLQLLLHRRPHPLKGPVMKKDFSSAQGNYLEITPKWDDLPARTITCST
jgi:hypothetical protein